MGSCDRKKTKFLCFSCLHYILPIVLLILVLFSQGFTIVFGLNYKYRQVSNLRLARIQRHIDKINKHPVFTILSPDGDIIDCIHKKKQIAFDHPLLKNHKIQKEPSKWPKMKEEAENESRKKEKQGWRTREIEEGWQQMWHQNGTGWCPKGTIPVRRSTVHDVLRAKSFYHFGKKPRPSSLPLDNRHKSVDSPDVTAIGHEHAIAYTETSEEIYGAKATINVWDPSIEEANEFSLSQIWLLSGSFDGSDLNSIEAGWQVSPELYGDSRPRLFTYWTSDSYEDTGCYNLLCSGFVQTNNRIAVGGAISPVSSFNRNQFDITLLIWKDPKFGNWWLSFGEDTIVGYWPGELFTHLEDHATIVEWGGEVVNSRVNGLHTSTQMGSGHFAEEGFSKASYFRNLEIVGSDNTLSSPQDIQTLAENSNCYDINSFYNTDWGHHFYYGGPGRNPNCP